MNRPPVASPIRLTKSISSDSEAISKPPKPSDCQTKFSYESNDKHFLHTLLTVTVHDEVQLVPNRVPSVCALLFGSRDRPNHGRWRC